MSGEAARIAGASSRFDHQMMDIALTVSVRGLGRTAPNPSVGAVIADESTREIIARGWTQPGGRPHAETEAIRQAGPRARGGTIYVTLEPCSHVGKTPPCADAIIEAGLRRVVVAAEDPDPRVSGRGIERLRAAGVVVDVLHGVQKERSRALLRGHIVRVTERRPFIQLKMALDEKGEAAQGRDGAPVWVTGPLARRFGHMMRARSDAILIGAATLRDDDPSLTCRLDGLSNRSPRPIVIGGQGAIPSKAQLFATRTGEFARHGSTLLALPADNQDGAAVFDDIPGGAEVVRLKTVGEAIWLPALAEELVARGITRVLVEGGPTIWQAMATARMVDEVVVFRALGPDGVHEAVGKTLEKLNTQAAGLYFKVTDVRRLGPDVMMVFRPAANATA